MMNESHSYDDWIKLGWQPYSVYKGWWIWKNVRDTRHIDKYQAFNPSYVYNLSDTTLAGLKKRISAWSELI